MRESHWWLGARCAFSWSQNSCERGQNFRGARIFAIFFVHFVGINTAIVGWIESSFAENSLWGRFGAQVISPKVQFYLTLQFKKPISPHHLIFFRVYCADIRWRSYTTKCMCEVWGFSCRGAREIRETHVKLVTLWVYAPKIVKRVSVKWVKKQVTADCILKNLSGWSSFPQQFRIHLRKEIAREREGPQCKLGAPLIEAPSAGCCGSRISSQSVEISVNDLRH